MDMQTTPLSEEQLLKDQNLKALAEAAPIETPADAETAFDKALTKASDDFGTLYQRFINQTKMMSKKDLMNLVQGLILYPLEEKDRIENWLKRPSTPRIVMDTFFIGKNLLDAKYVMIFSATMQGEQSEAGNSDSASTEEVGSQTQEIVNG